MFFVFPNDARWNADRQAVEFGIGIGEYEGVVRVPRHVFQRLIDGSMAPERCLEAFHLQRTRFELIAERKVRQRRLTDDGNVEITGRDLREAKRAPITRLATSPTSCPGIGSPSPSTAPLPEPALSPSAYLPHDRAGTATWRQPLCDLPYTAGASAPLCLR